MKKAWFAIIPMIITGFVFGACGSSTRVSDKPEATNEPKEYVKVAELEGTQLSGETFTLEGGDQKMIYTVNGNWSMCAVYILKSGTDLMTDGGIPDARTSDSGTFESISRKRAGDYYLHVSASPSCKVELYEKR
jgi:hypothetical protein